MDILAEKRKTENVKRDHDGTGTKSKQKNRTMNTVTIPVLKIEKETEKAVFALLQCSSDSNIASVKVWLPKSQCFFTDDTVELPAWLAEKKAQEASDEYEAHAFFGELATA